MYSSQQGTSNFPRASQVSCTESLGGFLDESVPLSSGAVEVPMLTNPAKQRFEMVIMMMFVGTL